MYLCNLFFLQTRRLCARRGPVFVTFGLSEQTVSIIITVFGEMASGTKSKLPVLTSTV